MRCPFSSHTGSLTSGLCLLCRHSQGATVWPAGIVPIGRGRSFLACVFQRDKGVVRQVIAISPMPRLSAPPLGPTPGEGNGFQWAESLQHWLHGGQLLTGRLRKGQETISSNGGSPFRSPSISRRNAAFRAGGWRWYGTSEKLASTNEIGSVCCAKSACRVANLAS